MELGFHLLRRAGYDETVITDIARVMEYRAVGPCTRVHPELRARTEIFDDVVFRILPKRIAWRVGSPGTTMRLRKPERYASQFGGYCAYAVSQGHTADGDPNVWRIVDGHLYPNYSAQVKKLWEQDVPGNIAKGRQNWPAVLTK